MIVHCELCTQHQHEDCSYCELSCEPSKGIISQQREAVEALYNSAHWKADRPCDEKKLWDDIKRLFNIPDGVAPKPI